MDSPRPPLPRVDFFEILVTRAFLYEHFSLEERGLLLEGAPRHILRPLARKLELFLAGLNPTIAEFRVNTIPISRNFFIIDWHLVSIDQISISCYYLTAFGGT